MCILAPMLMLPVLTSFMATTGPLVLTNSCTIRSLFVTVSVPPLASRTDWWTMNGPPFSDHAWHPCCWWWIRSVAPFGEAANALKLSVSADARKAPRAIGLSFIAGLLPILLVPLGCSVGRTDGAGIGAPTDVRHGV